MFALWGLIPSTVKWIGLSVLIGTVGFFAWNLEHKAKLKAQTKLATTEKGYKILNDGYMKLYQDREIIKEKASAQRRKLDAMEKELDLSGLRDTFNNPSGMLSPMRPNTFGGTKTPATYYDPTSPGIKYQEAP